MKNSEFHQLSLPLYLGEPFLPVKKKLRHPEARQAIDGIEVYGLVLQRLLDKGVIQSPEASLQIRSFLKVLGIE